MNIQTNKIKLHYLLGDVGFGGHDTHRVARILRGILDKAGAFDVLLVCDEPKMNGTPWEEYFREKTYEKADGFIFDCGNYRFNVREEQEIIENAVSGGAGIIFLHGEQVCFWKEAGMHGWDGFEKMVGLLWRNAGSHGDFGAARVKNTLPSHPVMENIPDFSTKDEIFCRQENPFGVPFVTLASAYSDPNTISRHNQPGTGNDEPVASVGSYGKGRTFNLSLGHVWTYYTGHGMGENTALAWSPKPLRMMFARACEWIVTGNTERTINFKA